MSGDRTRSRDRQSVGRHVGQPLGNDFFWLAHDHRTGRPRLRPRALAVGLAAALLGEVLIAGAIELRGGRLMIRDESPPAELLAQRIYAEVLADARRSPRTWVEVLSPSAEFWVVERLRRDGQIRVSWRRRLSSGFAGGRGAGRPRDPVAAAAVSRRLMSELDDGRPVPVSDAFLIGLAHATDLFLALPEGLSTQRDGRADQMTAGLPNALRHLVGLCEAGVGGQVGVRR
jgi:hypothetical protein